MAAASGEKIKSIEVALNNESRERDFYLMHSRRTTNNMGKLMFATLAQDEDEHYTRLVELHAKLSQDGTWPETVPLTVKGSNLQNVLKDFLKKNEKDSPAEIDDKEAIKIAIAFEEKGYAFYAGLRDSVDNAEEKKFFNILAGMEKEHLLSLKDSLLYFEDPVGWFASQEKITLDGC
jgi:rubrerythrin